MKATEAIQQIKEGKTLTDGSAYYFINGKTLWRTCGDPCCCLDDFDESQIQEVIESVAGERLRVHD